MSYRELPPHPALRPYVDRFWMRAPDATSEPAALSAAASARILPDGCIDVLIDVPGGAARVVGTMTHAVVADAPAQAIIAAVRFRPGGARPFLRVPAAELTDRVFTAGELGVTWLAGSPAEARAARAVLAALERSLLARLPAALQPEVGHAARRLFGARPPTVDELAREIGFSRQHLARLFREHVGVSPKELARVARLQRAIEHVQQAPAAGLASAALDLGYYDQAHMSRDFHELAGLTPGAAREARGSIFPIPSLWREA